jgi:hypothetical protein
MSTFRDAVAALLGKDAYILLSGTPTKAKISKINDDLVVLTLSDASANFTDLAIHIDNLVLITA